MKTLEQERRKDLMIILRENGDTYEQIGRVFGLTRERVRQVLNETEASSKKRTWKKRN